MKKAILLNDTSYENHHGCNIVIENIKNNLDIRGIEVVISNPIGQSWEKNQKLLDSLKIVDLVIINAEGTIHHNSKYGLQLLRIVNFVKNTPIVLLNMTYQDNSLEYIDLIKKFTKVYVRENKSYEELKHHEIESVIVPDMTFYSQYDYCNKNNNDILITDSHDIKKSERLYNTAIEKKWKYFPILSKYNQIHNLKGLLKKYKYSFINLYGKYLIKIMPLKYSYKRYMYIYDKDKYISTLSKSYFLITARFHTLCFAIQTKTNFCAITSNSHKIEGLLTDIGLKNKIVSIDELVTLDIKQFILNSSELQLIDNYLYDAKIKINQMFDDIALLIKDKTLEKTT
jgi:hypothetical protein